MIADGAQRASLLEGVIGHIPAIIVEMIPAGDHAIMLCDVESAHAEGDGLRCSADGEPTTI